MSLIRPRLLYIIIYYIYIGNKTTLSSLPFLPVVCEFSHRMLTQTVLDQLSLGSGQAWIFGRLVQVVNVSTVQEHFDHLKNKGLIRRMGPD